MFNINDYVSIKNSNIKGTILNISKNNIYTILLDTNQKINVNESKIEHCYNYDTLKSRNKHNNNVSITYNLKETEFENELMIRHQTVAEALENVDRFISDAIVNKEKRLRIIHGRHGWILKDAVHEYLKNSPFVESFHLADEYEGSIGVTIVYLK